jgi:hypothetical protein
MFQPFLLAAWTPFLEWYILPEHKASPGSALWHRTTTAWKSMAKDIQVLPPQLYDEWLTINFWLRTRQAIIGAGFTRCRAIQLHNASLKRITNVWSEEYQLYLSGP